MTIYYPDIYSGQTGMPLTNALVAMVKATEGTGYTNPDFAAAKTRAAQSGSFFCAYHFLLEGNAAQQAAHAYSVAGKTPLMLDFETEPNIGSFPSLSDAEQFIDAYRKLGGIVYLLYFPRWYWASMGSPSLAPMIQRGMLLVSSAYTTYTDDSSGTGWQPYGGMTPVVWQYSDSTPFNGFNIDFNAFRGHYAGKQDPASVAACLGEFKALVTTGQYPHPQPSDWTYGPVRNLTARAGHTSVALDWDAPADAPVEPDHYLVYVYKGTICSVNTIVDTYPRTANQANLTSGSLSRGTVYTAHVVACGPNGSHVKPFVYASVQFKTGWIF